MEIKGIEITKAHIGRRVIYAGHCSVREEGTITSFNEHYVFVRYGAGTTSQATNSNDLDWVYRDGQRGTANEP